MLGIQRVFDDETMNFCDFIPNTRGLAGPTYYFATSFQILFLELIPQC